MLLVFQNLQHLRTSSFQLESNFAPQRERRESLTCSLTFPDLGWLVNVFLKNAGIVDHVRIV